MSDEFLELPPTLDDQLKAIKAFTGRVSAETAESALKVANIELWNQIEEHRQGGSE